jgi:hypothetical protein
VDVEPALLGAIQRGEEAEAVEAAGSASGEVSIDPSSAFGE